MNHAQVREAVNRYQGIDREGVTLRIGDRFVIPARFEEGHSKEEKMAAVHYIRFAVPAEGTALLAGGASLSLVVDHPNYNAKETLPPNVRAELLRDLDLASATA
jgi:hypothetical protein